MTSSHLAPHPDIGAYVLGALAPDEATDLEAHLRGCARCTAEVHSLDTVESLLHWLAMTGPDLDALRAGPDEAARGPVPAGSPKGRLVLRWRLVNSRTRCAQACCAHLSATWERTG